MQIYIVTYITFDKITMGRRGRRPLPNLHLLLFVRSGRRGRRPLQQKFRVLPLFLGNPVNYPQSKSK